MSYTCREEMEHNAPTKKKKRIENGNGPPLLRLSFLPIFLSFSLPPPSPLLSPRTAPRTLPPTHHHHTPFPKLTILIPPTQAIAITPLPGRRAGVAALSILNRNGSHFSSSHTCQRLKIQVVSRLADDRCKSPLPLYRPCPLPSFGTKLQRLDATSHSNSSRIRTADLPRHSERPRLSLAVPARPRP